MRRRTATPAALAITIALGGACADAPAAPTWRRPATVPPPQAFANFAFAFLTNSFV
jgi:hypothetical protein